VSVELSDRILSTILITPLTSDELLIAKDFAEHARRTEIERDALRTRVSGLSDMCELLQSRAEADERALTKANRLAACSHADCPTCVVAALAYRETYLATKKPAG
jgi:hypothetical protein